MRSVPIKSKTEGIVGNAAAWIEFDLTDDLGFQEWRGMLEEVGAEGRLFNAYMVQTLELEISGTPVQLHVFPETVYITPPFSSEEYYIQLDVEQVLLARTYFRIPPERENMSLDGYKPPLADMLAMDVWVRAGGSSADNRQAIYTFFYEATVRTETREYHIRRFSLDHPWQ